MARFQENQSGENRNNLRDDLCEVTIDRLDEIDSQHVQEPYKFGYRYTISIHNRSSYTVQILSRRWVVKDGDMKDKIVEGEGVVGQLPILEPGETHTYQSYHIMRSRYGSASGAYYGVYTDDPQPKPEFAEQGAFILSGDQFQVPIPDFNLIHHE